MSIDVSQPPTLEQLLAAPVVQAASQQSGRNRALDEIAFAHGVRLGLARKSYELQIDLKQRSADLDRLYPFYSLVLTPANAKGETHSEAMVTPPVLTEVRGEVQKDAQVIRFTDAIYRIVEPPKYVHFAPTWRDYVLPTLIAAAMSPEPASVKIEDSELSIWRQGLTRGYKQGEQQALQILGVEMQKLTTAFVGQTLYHVLLRQGMVTEPRQVVDQTAITTGKDGELGINARTYRIEINPAFRRSPGAWKPLVEVTSRK